MTVSPLGDSAVLIALGETIDPGTVALVQAVAAEIKKHPPAGVIDVVPAFASVAVFFEPTQHIGFDAKREELEVLIARANREKVSVHPRTVEIPVCYGGEVGPDLEHVAAHAKLSADEVVGQHASADYQVHAIGFAPGFPYLGGLPSTLATPRRASPRARVAAGSVGIGGAQTGIYPLETPGGWNLIGRTPLTLFDPLRPEPAILRAGDRVKFRVIDAAEFSALSRSEIPRREERVTGDGHGAVASPIITNDSGVTRSSLHVLRAGMLSTIQDPGRRGHRAQGVPLSGAADPFAVRLVNLLVGNSEGAAVIEFTLVGPELKFSDDTVIAIGGGEFSPLPRWRPLLIRGGATIKLGSARNGCRGYLAIAGGIDVPVVLESRSTYVRAGLGGFHGRALADGDVLPVHLVHRGVRNHWRIDERILPAYSSAPRVRVVRGQNAGEFDDAWLQGSFRVSPQSDRMGIRLHGTALARTIERDLISMPVAPGTVQVPPDGQPIVLLADAQTIGGYPQVAHVISVDLPLMAQVRPGDTVRFQLVSLEHARDLMVAQERAIGLLREGLAEKLA